MSEPLSDNFARSCRNAYELKRSESVGIEEEDEETDADVASFEASELMLGSSSDARSVLTLGESRESLSF